MNRTYKLLAVLSICTILLSHCRRQETPAGSDEQATDVSAWPELQKENRPWTRWWWMGNAVDKQNIDRLLSEYARSGMGGVEIAPIYGAMGHEDRYLDFLSPDWMEMLSFTVHKADSLNMGVDLTQGTGWPLGGPQVGPEHAASMLIVQTYSLSGGEKLPEALTVEDPKQRELNPTLQAVIAYAEEDEIVDITDKVRDDGILDWTAPSGSWEIYAAWDGNTRQMVKRAAPGGVGYTLDHLSREAVNHYLDYFEDVFKGDNFGVRAFYNDSYEVYNANWSSDFFEEFQQRRGYDLRPYLRELVSEEEGETIARLKADYRETMGEMLLENFTKPWTDWAHQHNSLTKNQAHGSPGNLLDLYAAVDIPECETFGSSYFPVPGLRRDSADVRNVDPDPIMLKFASSAANAKGKPYTSSETFTWLGEHFKTSFSQMKPELEQVFLSGVNHIFYHGVTYSPEDVEWPGWLFYASLNLTPANSLWPHFKGFNDYVTRCQSVLQAGKSDNELLVYWPIHDVYTDAKGMEKMIKVHDIDEWLHPTQFYQQSKSLMEAGYSLDFVSDNMLMEAEVREGHIYTDEAASPRQVLIVPQSRYIPLTTFERIIALAEAGATVMLQDLPHDVPGLHELGSRREQLEEAVEQLSFRSNGNGIQQMQIGNGQILLARNIQQALAEKGIEREALSDTGLRFIRRAVDDGKFYYLVNHTAEIIDTTIPLNVAAASVLIMDPQSSRTGLAASSNTGGSTRLRVQMQPGEALVLRTSESEIQDVEAWEYLGSAAEPITLNGEWSLRFTEGGPALPDDQQLDQLQSWTELPDSRAEAFSGSAAYTTTFNLPAKVDGDYILDLGRVAESARVWINGEEVGLLWSIPFQARVGQYLKEGDNTLKVEVTNLMANRIRDMDRKGIEWRKYHEINFVNIDYKPFDASAWEPMVSGLIGPVTLTPYHTVNQ